MTYLLDTHTLLWWAKGDELSNAASKIISEPENLVFVSAATIWEISIKEAIGKLKVDGSLDALVDEDFETLPISLEDARSAGSLPLRHKDPFDRMLIAQAQLKGMTILTRDAQFASYEVEIIEV